MAKRSDAPLILLVDDFQDGREMYAEYLTFKGIRVMTAESGEESIALALRHRPTVILMDLEMRGTHGTAAMRLLREHTHLAMVPIIAFTARAMQEDVDRAINDGFDAVIGKPCLPDDLIRILAPYLVSENAVSA